MKNTRRNSFLSISALLFIGLFFCIFNVCVNGSQMSSAKKSGVQLMNIRAMQASAGEMTCDATNPNLCTIQTPGGTGYGTGNGRF